MNAARVHPGIKGLAFVCAVSVVVAVAASTRAMPPRVTDSLETKDRNDEPEFVEVIVHGHGFGGSMSVKKVLTRRTGRAELGEILRRKYPYVSLRPRLEKFRSSATRADPSRIDLTDYREDFPRDEDRRNAFPKAGRDFYINIGPERVRSRALECLHSENVNDFIDQKGFGLGRLGEPPEDYILLLDEAEFFPESVPPTAVVQAKAVNHADNGNPSTWVPQSELMSRVVSDHQNGFARIKTFGHFIDLDRVSGFQPHSFLHRPDLIIGEKEDQKRNQANPAWKITRLQLVSLLMHDEPAVYVSKSLPRMSELVERPVTRELDDFEQAALAELEAGENVVYRATLNHIEMVGAIRAVNQCLQCHQVERGALLGAFSYSLFRDPPAEAPNEEAISAR